MHAINANFNYGTKIISCGPLKCLCFDCFEAPILCPNLGLCFACLSQAYIKVVGGCVLRVRWATTGQCIFSANGRENNFCAIRKIEEAPEKKNSSSSEYIEFLASYYRSMAYALQIAGNAMKCKYNVRIYVLI